MRKGHVLLFDKARYEHVRVLFQYARDGRVIRVAGRLTRPDRGFLYRPCIYYRSPREWNAHVAFGFGFLAFGIHWTPTRGGTYQRFGV